MVFYGHGFGRARRHERLLERGNFKYLILDLIGERPNHGYEVIRTLEERSGGLYTPSPGVVYPTLQLLEDMGCVAVSVENGKKAYAITDEGRRMLAEQAELVSNIKSRMTEWRDSDHAHELHQAMHELRDIAYMVRTEGRRVGADTLRQIGGVVSRAREEIEALLKQ